MRMQNRLDYTARIQNQLPHRIRLGGHVGSVFQTNEVQDVALGVTGNQDGKIVIEFVRSVMLYKRDRASSPNRFPEVKGG